MNTLQPRRTTWSSRTTVRCLERTNVRDDQGPLERPGMGFWHDGTWYQGWSARDLMVLALPEETA